MTEEKKYRFYGRRAGRKLRPARQSLMKELLPSLSVPSDAPLDPSALFSPEKKAYHLEIGFGNGEHLAWRAQQNPDIGFIGCEMFVNGLAALLSVIDRDRLTNIRLHSGDARGLIARLKPHSLSCCYLLFPDPWPKKRHWDRRFVHSGNIDAIARLLIPGGELLMATDDPSYLLWMLWHMRAHDRDFTWMARGAQDWENRDWPMTRYEAKARKAGRTPHFLRYRRK